VSLSQVLLILWRRGWIVALTLLTTMILATAILLFVPKRYDAVATGSIDPGAVDPVTQAGAGGGMAIGLMQGNMLQLVTSQRVALDVVKRLNLVADPTMQASYRNSDSFGRERVEDWIAASLIKNVDPKFALGTNVLTIKYKSADPQKAADIANAFLAATIDATIAMKAASGDQTARWFDPQLESLRKELEDARAALENFQSRTNLVAPTAAGDTESSALMSISQDLQSNRAVLTALQSRLSSGNTNLAVDPSDPDLRLLNGLKEKLTTLQTEVETGKTALGANNPKMVAAAANMVSLRKQVAEATEKMLQHLKERISTTQNQIASLEAEQAAAEKALIAAQAQRFRLGLLQTDVRLREEQVNKRKEEAAKLKLQSQLTFANVAVLDKATPPIEPFFPKRPVVLSVAISASAILGLILALIAEMLDRRVRSTADLEFVTSAPTLGTIQAPRRAAWRLGGAHGVRPA
jgi:polysaccharide biosynthesis transport protein